MALAVVLAAPASGRIGTEPDEPPQATTPAAAYPPAKAAPDATPTPDATPSPTARPGGTAGAAARASRTLVAGPVTVTAGGFLSWALLDRASGRIAGSSNVTATTTTESMIKIWLVADFLRRTAQDGRQPGEGRLAQARRAIRDSDDAAAESLYRAGGGNASVERMIARCRLTDTKRHDGSWSQTRISARDAVRLGRCVADGTAAGPAWTRWVLTEMTRVRGTTAAADQPAGGRWGIIDGLPAELRRQPIGLKNGWTPRRDGLWHVNCLAVSDDWVLAVLTRYPIRKGLRHGGKLCAEVTRQLVSDAP